MQLMIVVRVVVFALGVGIAAATLWSAVLTVVVPRAERSFLSKAHFNLLLGVFRGAARLSPSEAGRDAILARYAPVALTLLPFMWAAHVIIGFASMFWALEGEGWKEALILSGSSLTTLGFRTREDSVSLALAIGEALIGLGLVALLISYLPTIYSNFQVRERSVARLEVRAGRPPDPGALILRSHRIGWLGSMDQTWAEWEEWFVLLEEAHTTHLSLNFFRSTYPGRSWITAAGTSLDAAALVLSAVDVEKSFRAALCIRSGFLALQAIADSFRIEYDAAPGPHTPISIDRAEFDALLDRLAGGGVPLHEDRAQAWADYRGWRVNYDAPLVGLCRLIQAPSAPWSSDRIS